MSDINNMETIGKNIKYAREDKGIAQNVLASKLNISAASVSNWEKGKRMPDITNLIAICNALDVESDQILGLKTSTGIDKNHTILPENSLSEIEKDLLSKFRQLNKDNKYKCMTYIIDILDKQIENEVTDKKKRKGAWLRIALK